MVWFRAILFVLFGATTHAQESCQRIGPAVIKGKKFFDSRSGKYIPLKGINYYPRPNAGELSTGNNRDFFSEEFRDVWERDIEYFKSLGINVVRLYAVNPGLDHSGFMCALQQAGIYVIIGLAANCEGCAITGMEAPNCYPAELKERGQFVINIFAKYENVLAFSAGNEAHLFAPGKPVEHNAPCQKQFIRDMRAYIDSCENLRKIPVGVAVADFDRDAKALYYNCRSDSSDEFENAEWYGLNIYLHCNPSAQTVDDLDGFQDLLASHRSYNMSIPVILTEFGCMNARFPTIDGFAAQRDFIQVDAIHSPLYQDYFAGGITFEYSAEKKVIEERTSYPVFWPFREYSRYNYGIGFFSPEDCNDVDTPCKYNPYPEFDNLAARHAAVMDDTSIDFDSFTPEPLPVTECPSIFPPLSSFEWESDSMDDLECVGPNYVFVCPNQPADCLPPFARPATPPPTPSPTSPPTLLSIAPTTQTPNDTPLPTDEPSVNTETPPPTTAPSTREPTTLNTMDESPIATSPTATTEETPAPSKVPISTPSPLYVGPFVPTETATIVEATSSSAKQRSIALRWIYATCLLLTLHATTIT